MASTRLLFLYASLARLVLLGPLGVYIISFIVENLILSMRKVSPGEGDIKVIACGFFRSGTMSLKVALDRLGFLCYHGVNVIADNGEHAKLFLQAATEEKWDKWPQILQGYSSIADYPAAYFYKQLMVAYPNAKVILNVRDPDRWYHSVVQTSYWLRGLLVPYIFKNDAMKSVETLVWQGQFKGRFEDKEFAIEVYKSHVAEVKSIVPKEKLLVYEVKEGWAPLCKFLEVDIPDTPFPHINDSSTFRNVASQRHNLLYAVAAVYVGVVWSVLTLLVKWLYQFHWGTWPQFRQLVSLSHR